VSVADFIQQCMDAGMPFDMALTAARVFEAATTRPVKVRSPGAERQARYRERHQASQVTESDVCDASDALGSPPPSFPPEPPKPPTPTPGYITTRARAGFAKPNGFARFWEAYPRKVGKGAAEKAYATALRIHGGHDPLGDLFQGQAPMLPPLP